MRKFTHDAVGNSIICGVTIALKNIKMIERVDYFFILIGYGPDIKNTFPFV